MLVVTSDCVHESDTCVHESDTCVHESDPTQERILYNTYTYIVLQQLQLLPLSGVT